MRDNLLVYPFNSQKKSDAVVPFFSPHLGTEEIEEVVATLRSGWLTTGPQVKAFEKEFAESVNAKYAVALNSCTAALHLAVEAVGLREGQAVLVPTMTFAATAEIIQYKGAIPILVDCDPITGNIDLSDAESKIALFRNGKLPVSNDRGAEVVGMIPVHVGGYMVDVNEVMDFAKRHDLWVIEDAAHAFPAAYRRDASEAWRYCGENTALVTCYSFYANKTITTGEGGMAVTDDKEIADRIRLMSLHGLSHDAWGRYSGSGSWDYRIVHPGYKYNLTDIAAAIGRHQLARAEEMRRHREAIADFYLASLAGVSEIDLPPTNENRIHSWHLFPIQLNIDDFSITRNQFMEEMKKRGVNCSVHWRPLHMHPLYMERFGWNESHFPIASRMWPRIVSLPIFSAMSLEQTIQVVDTVKSVCAEFAVRRMSVVA
jgi:perosamine synthetase